MQRRFLYGLFFLSGASALVYELIWERLLHLLLGTSTLAVSAVLAAFLGGLALGGFLFGRLADRTQNPLRLYAWLEAGIGVTALLVPVAFSGVASLYVIAYDALQPGLWGGALLRLTAASAVLLIPATLIGGTLPVMARLALKPNSATAPTFSLLYGVNTLGAVLGAALTGFVGLYYLGMTTTLALAAGLNGLVALGAVLASRSHLSATLRSTTADGAVAPASVWQGLALGCAAATGAITLGEEVVWTRVLGILTSNGAYAFALMLTVMLLGIGLGGLVQYLWSRRGGDSWARLALVQGMLGGVGLASLWFFRSPPDWLERGSDGSSTTTLFFSEMLLTATALLVPAFLTGLSFPLLVTGVSQSPARFGGWLGRLYAFNTAGCVAGALAAGLVFIPWLGLQNTLALLAAASLGVAAVAWACAARPRPLWRGVCGTVVLAAALVAWWQVPVGIYRKTAVGDAGEMVYYKEGDNGTVSVVQEESGRRWLLVDGQPVAGNGRTIVIDQKMLAHLPLLLHPAPQRALTVGFGSGGTSHSMTLHGVQVDCVEIERAVPGAAAQFSSENHDVLSDPHFRLVVDDARSWLRVAPERYDAVVTDCTNLQYKSNGDLYTVEYFRLMKERLTTDGLAAAWVPANGIDERDLKTLLRSFREVFPHTSVWFMNTLATDFLIVVGTPNALDVDMDRLRERMAAPATRADLETVGLADPCRLLYTFLEADDEVLAYVGPGPLNTDDCPVLSYSAYGAGFRSTIATNLVGLLAHRTDVRQHVRHPAAEIEMLHHYAASNEAVLGHIALQRGDERTALRHYVEGAKLLPQDKSFPELSYYSYLHLTADR